MRNGLAMDTDIVQLPASSLRLELVRRLVPPTEARVCPPAATEVIGAGSNGQLSENAYLVPVLHVIRDRDYLVFSFAESFHASVFVVPSITDPRSTNWALLNSYFFPAVRTSTPVAVILPIRRNEISLLASKPAGPPQRIGGVCSQ